MPRETRLLGFGVGSKMTQQQAMTPAGPQTDENGMPVMINVLELIFIDQHNGDIIVVPLTPEGVEAVKAAISPTSIVVPPPGSLRL